jgi:hypothetical protein
MAGEAAFGEKKFLRNKAKLWVLGPDSFICTKFKSEARGAALPDVW